MKTIKWYIEFDTVGAKRSGTFEVEDDATEEEIEEEARDNAFNHIDWGYSEKNDT